MTRWYSAITGGRPMQFIELRFSDVVSGRWVSLWVDHFGQRWLAESAWSCFRVRAIYNENGDELP